MTDVFLAAVAQMTSTDDRQANRVAAEELIRRAASMGAQLVVLPEMWPYIGDNRSRLADAEDLDGPSTRLIRELSAELRVTIFGGTIAERSEDGRGVHNTAIAAGPDGALLARYRKIHLFDVDIPGGAQFRESDDVTAGDRAVVCDTALGRVGMTTCYDLRFPLLYERLREAGCTMVTVPSAFTAHTGKDHWEVLLRARAIEQQVYVLAADQGGWHNRGRQSHGHSMIVDPWGLVVARASDGPGLALAPIDPQRLAQVRVQLPCGRHRRPFFGPAPA